MIRDPEKRYNLYNVSEFVIGPKQTVMFDRGESEPNERNFTSTLITPLIPGKYQIYLVAKPKDKPTIEIISNKINFEVEERYIK